MTDFKDKYEGLDLKQLARKFKMLREKHEDLKSKAAAIWHEVDYLRFEAIPEKMEDDNISTCVIDNVGRLSTRVEASVKTNDKNLLRTWLIENGAEDLLSETINSSSLKAYIMNRIRDGQDIPGAEVIEFKPFTVATLTKA
ncbi:MAG: hypothetical protein OEQ39_00265 [Gammaproteobacteria bacterium]|nr:hypothetical protein [Gammaproteobacteria bacterium]